MGNYKSRFNKKISTSYQELEEFIVKKDQECIICFYPLDDEKSISKNCMVNNCHINAHKECIYQWYLRKKVCPICNTTWKKPPQSKKSCLDRLLS